jgi:hypothetical protein
MLDRTSVRLLIVEKCKTADDHESRKTPHVIIRTIRHFYLSLIIYLSSHDLYNLFF